MHMSSQFDLNAVTVINQKFIFSKAKNDDDASNTDNNESMS